MIVSDSMLDTPRKNLPASTDLPTTDFWMQEYSRLAEAMRALRREDIPMVLRACSVLHPRHPIPADQIALLASLRAEPTKAEMPPSLAGLFAKWLKTVLAALHQSASLLVLKGLFWGPQRRAMKEPALVLLKTWFFKMKDSQDDFYFGSLQTQLAEKGVSSLLLCGDGMTAESRWLGRFLYPWRLAQLSRRWLKSRPARRFPEALLIPWWAPIVTAFRLGTASLQLRRRWTTAGTAEEKRLLAAVAVDALRPFTVQSALQYWIARNAVKAWKPQAFLTLYEGHPWETLTWLGVQAASLSCIRIGYQHTVIMKHCLNIRQPQNIPGEVSAPQYILCTGPTARGMLQPGHHALRTQFINFGSFRRSKDQEPALPPRPSLKTVLVVPEGNLPECQRLFNFALQMARQLPDHSFIFRCHPMLPFERVQPHLSEEASRLANIEISRAPAIADDFRRASIILYRGSSSVLYAVLAGLKPLYLHLDAAYDIDPLFALDSWRQTVSTASDAADLLQSYGGFSPETASMEWRAADAFVRDYSQPVGRDAMGQVLKIVSQKGNR